MSPLHSNSPVIRAGRVDEIDRSRGDWVIVDPGFSSAKRSCGVMVRTESPEVCTFGELTHCLVALAAVPGPPLHLVIEAPLSIAFNAGGNPVGRSIERRGSQVRYWYAGLGCAVLVATTHLLRALFESERSRDVLLFEGLVSFKDRARPSNHCEDVVRLAAVLDRLADSGRIVPPEALLADHGHTLMSAFRASGMDFGVPPVLEVLPS